MSEYSDFFADDGTALAGAYGPDLGSWSSGWDIGTPISTNTGPSSSSAGGGWTNALLGLGKVAGAGLQAYNSFATTATNNDAINRQSATAAQLALLNGRARAQGSLNLAAAVPWIIGGVVLILISVLFLGRRGK